MLSIVLKFCTISVSRAAVDRIQASTVRSIAEAAAATGARVLNVESRFCDSSRCFVARNGDPLYQDAMRITPNMSASLAPDFVAVLTD